jgi:SAM-dependent methyltransferase
VIQASESPLVRALLSETGWDVDTLISPLDTMYTASLPRGHEAALVEYFQRGIESVHASAAVAASLATRAPRILEFAAGFGRLTRFLVKRYDPSRIVTSDIDEPAVDFCRERIGVRSVLSAMEPEDLAIDGKFDLILVYSLFSHLPADRFTRWLARLYTLLDDGGFLVISVHDDRSVPPEHRGPDGFTFTPDSESRFLESAVYGSTWISPDYARRAIAETCPGARTTHVPWGLSNYQDVYVIGRGATAAPFDPGPFGFFDVCRREADQIQFIGWAAHHDPSHRAASVHAILGGRELGSTTIFTPRPEVALFTGEPRHAMSGWGITAPFPESSAPNGGALLIKAVSETGASSFHWVGYLSDAFLASTRAENEDLRRRLQESEDLRRRLQESERELARLEGSVWLRALKRLRLL